MEAALESYDVCVGLLQSKPKTPDGKHYTINLPNLRADAAISVEEVSAQRCPKVKPKRLDRPLVAGSSLGHKPLLLLLLLSCLRSNMDSTVHQFPQRCHISGSDHTDVCSGFDVLAGLVVI